jgi:methionyl-tRNA formyltransferase
MNKKKIVLLSYPNLMGAACIETFTDRDEFDLVGIVMSDRVFKNKTTFQDTRLIIKRMCYKVCNYLIIVAPVAWTYLRVKSLPRAFNSDIPIHFTKDVNSKLSRDFISSLEPDMIASCYFNQVIGSQTIELAPECVNVHGSMLPENRGPDPAFWALEKGLEKTGITIHKVDDDIDTGLILYQEEFPVIRDSLLWFDFCLWKRASELLADWIADPSKYPFEPIDQKAAPNKYETWPTAEEVNSLLSKGIKLFTFKHLFKCLSIMVRKSRP